MTCSYSPSLLTGALKAMVWTPTLMQRAVYLFICSTSIHERNNPPPEGFQTSSYLNIACNNPVVEAANGLVRVALDLSRHLCDTVSATNRTLQASSISIYCTAVVLLHYKLNGYSCYCVQPLWRCSPAVPCYSGSNCTVSLCFTLCPKPYITPAFAHSAILQPQELCIMLCNSQNLLEKFMQLCAFISRIHNWTRPHSVQCELPLHWTLIYLL